MTVKDLMEKLIEIEFVYAKHLNPLTELPGNLMIEQQLEKALIGKDKKTILYFDLDNFKAYNDLYGFENGDRVLKEFAEILKTGSRPNISLVILVEMILLPLFPKRKPNNCADVSLGTLMRQ